MLRHVIDSEASDSLRVTWVALRYYSTGFGINTQANSKRHTGNSVILCHLCQHTRPWMNSNTHMAEVLPCTEKRSCKLQTHNCWHDKVLVHEAIAEVVPFKHQEISIMADFSTNLPERHTDQYGQWTKWTNILQRLVHTRILRSHHTDSVPKDQHQEKHLLYSLLYPFILLRMLHHNTPYTIYKRITM